MKNYRVLLFIPLMVANCLYAMEGTDFMLKSRATRKREQEEKDGSAAKRQRLEENPILKKALEEGLFLAAESNLPVMIETFVHQGVDVGVQDLNGVTPLHYACYRGSHQAAKALLDDGAKVNARDGYDMTPLHYAAQEGCLEIAQLLLDHGANIKMKKELDGKTPFHAAVENNQFDVAELLLKRGSNIEEKLEYGWTALHLAAHEGESERIKFLVDHGANLDAQTPNKRTPLHLAIAGGNLNSVKLLLAFYRTQRQKEWAAVLQKALELAASNGVEFVFDYLVELGADPLQHHRCVAQPKHTLSDVLEDIVMLSDKPTASTDCYDSGYEE